MSFNKKRKFQGGNANTSNKDTKAAPLLFSRSEKNFTTVLNQLEPELRELFTIAGTMISGRVPDHIRPMAHKLGLWLQFPLPGDTTNASVHILNPTKNTVTVPSGRDLNTNLLQELDRAATSTSSSSTMQTPTTDNNSATDGNTSTPSNINRTDSIMPMVGLDTMTSVSI